MQEATQLNLGLPLSTLYAFLFVLGRVSGLVVFVPVAGLRAAPDLVRIILALGISIALFPSWPSLPNVIMSPAQLTASVFAETGFGIATGLAVAFFTEAFQLAAQFIGLQAGYGYATTIDPSSQADAGILQILTMLVSGLLFFTFGFDREILRVLAASFSTFPAGSWGSAIPPGGVDVLLQLGAAMFSFGFRLAMPVIALLLLMDLSLALLGRMQQQLQLLSLAFPLKILVALALLAALAPGYSRMFETSGTRAITALWRLVAH